MVRRTSAVNFQFEDASTCTGTPCTSAQILSSPINGKDNTQIESRYLAVHAFVSRVRTIDNPSDVVKLEPAPSKLLLLDPLSVALRI
jgi:hypothetical protein